MASRTIHDKINDGAFCTSFPAILPAQQATFLAPLRIRAARTCLRCNKLFKISNCIVLITFDPDFFAQTIIQNDLDHRNHLCGWSGEVILRIDGKFEHAHRG